MVKSIIGIVLVATFSLASQVVQSQETLQSPAKAPETQTAPTAPAQQPLRSVPELLTLAGKAYEEKSYEDYQQVMSELHAQRPNNSEYMYRLVLANALLDEKTDAFNLMLTMQRQGLSYDFDKTDDSINLRKTQLYTYLNDLMVDAGRPLGKATPIATLGPEVLLPEGIEWDASRDAFLVSTVKSGSILAVNREGESKEIFKADESNRVWGIQDIVVDPERNRLWAVTTASESYEEFDPTDKGRSALVEFDLTSMEIIKRYPVPVDGLPHSLRQVTVAPNGDIYAIDGVYPILYKKAAAEKSLKGLSAYKRLVSLRGMAISDDGNLLYLADYEMGVIVINLETMASQALVRPETLNLGGVTGLNYWDGQLVVIQSGIKPQRVMTLELDAAGIVVSNVAALAVNLESMDYPSYGTVVGDELFFFVNSHWATNLENAKPVIIARTLLSDAPKIVSAGAEKFKKDYEEAKLRGDAKAIKLDGSKKD